MTTQVSVTPRAVMLTPSAIAQRDGISRQAAAKMARQLVEKHGLQAEYDARGRVAAVNVAQYDSLRQRFADPSKVQAPRQSHEAEPPVANESYDEALRQKTWHEAERRRIDLEVQKRNLIEVARLADAIAMVGEEIVAVIGRLPSLADLIAQETAREGRHGAQTVLRQHANAMRDEISKALRALAVTHVERDARPSETECQTTPIRLF